LARSLNVPAVRLLREHGPARFHGELRALGMTTLSRPPDGYGLTLILGGAEGTLWDLTRMYARLAGAAAGRGPAGDIGAGAAWLTLDALVDVVRPEEEALWKTFASGQKIAWKTGTSIGFRDGWAIGVDGSRVVGVWTGNASGEGRADLTGTAAAAPVMFELFRRLGPGGWFTRPEWDMTTVAVCADDGLLPAEGCAAKTVWAPAAAAFQSTSPNHKIVHLDPAGRWRVHEGCEAPSRMRHAPWFSLPPVEESYYKRHHPEYAPPPPWRPDCLGAGSESPVALIYPHPRARIYIPVELGGTKGRAVFEAAHADAEAVLHWHLDGRYVGSTRTMHQLAVDVEPGRHDVTVVDGRGNHQARPFEALGL
jgi:penicillin-binding protein 1C